ncbi:MAG: ABC transporter permease [Acidobacteria bacterium]|nr:ABC transporter permease [Acidobacteriota bacterium]MBV9438132.1 ABC transporter permease [Acidobacteriota bacterium]
MVKHLFPNQLALGFVQAGITAVLAIVVALLARKRDIHVEWETMVALLRGLAQIVGVGFILVVMLKGPQWTSAFMLSAMVLAAGATSARRAKKVPGSFAVSFWSILIGAGSVIAVMTWAGVIDGAITSIVPVGSMVIANAMNTNALALERFHSEVEAHVGEIESALALGAAAEVSVSREVQRSFSASLIPSLNNLRSLGLVWIPGLMAGMVLSGSSPLYAAIYQFVVIAMIFGSSGLTSLLCTAMIRKKIFTTAEQLALS